MVSITKANAITGNMFNAVSLATAYMHWLSRTTVWQSLDTHRWRTFWATLCSLWVGHRLLQFFLVPRPLRHLPKVGTIDWFWSVLKGESTDVRSDRLMLPIMAQHGLCLKYMMGRWTVSVGDPILLQTVLKDVETFPKEENVSFDPDLILTNKEANVGNSNAEGWRRQRRVANPVFHRAMPVQVFGEIVETIFRTIDEKETLHAVDIADYMKRYALDCLGLGVFSFDMGAVRDSSSPYSVLYRQAFSIVRDPLVYLFPAYTRIPSRWIPYRNRARLANERLRAILADIVEQRKQAIKSNTLPENRKDLLTMMIEACIQAPKENGDNRPYLTDGELIANLAVFFVAGHETTAGATASMMYYFAANPDIQERARQEVIAILGDEPKDIIPTAEQLRQMTFLDNCIKETLRINPPTSGNLPRIVSRDTFLGDFFIPKGTPLSLELYCAHRLSKFWPDPTQFNPDRFQQDGNSKFWMPFGYGPRACIGMNFSLAEQRVLQAMMLRKYSWTLSSQSEHATGLKNATGGGIGLLGPRTLHLRLTKRY